MSTKTVFLIAVLVLIVAAGTQALAADDHIMVDTKRRTADKQWKPEKTVLLRHLQGFQPREDAELSPYGGLMPPLAEGTGFFAVRKIGDRWWLLDPDGCRFVSVGMNTVTTNPTPGGAAAQKDRFGTRGKWAEETARIFRSLGINTLGRWSIDEAFRAEAARIPYTTSLDFMSDYGAKRGGTYEKPGHTGYPKDCPFVFDPGFESFSKQYAQKRLAATKDDPWLLGHFSDNELPLRGDALDRYLKLPATEPGHQAAKRWAEQHKAVRGPKGYPAEHRKAFLYYAVERYHRIVADAIRQADPNHLVLGSRVYGKAMSMEAVFRACGPHVDVVSVNYYYSWTPDPKRMASWAQWSDKPFLVTEWYAKGMDSGMTNITGAGWTVKTQADRAAFYQNFAIGLLRSPACVGWHWHRYMDNDPADKLADPSNIDSNKGIVSNRYRLYTTLTDGMRELNRQVYPLREFLLGGQ